MAGTSFPSLTSGRPARAADVTARTDWVQGHIVPMNAGSTTTGVYDLGTSTAAWKDVYLSGDVKKGGVVGPSFAVHLNSTNQTISSGVWTKVAWNTEIYDTNNNFDPVTNYRFTPTVAGKYQLNAGMSYVDTLSQNVLTACAIYKNGSDVSHGLVAATGVAVQGAVASTICDANGTTDYFEAYAYQTAGVARRLDGAPPASYFSGGRIF